MKQLKDAVDEVVGKMKFLQSIDEVGGVNSIGFLTKICKFLRFTQEEESYIYGVMVAQDEPRDYNDLDVMEFLDIITKSVNIEDEDVAMSTRVNNCIKVAAISSRVQTVMNTLTEIGVKNLMDILIKKQDNE